MFGEGTILKMSLRKKTSIFGGYLNYIIFRIGMRHQVTGKSTYQGHLHKMAPHIHVDIPLKEHNNSSGAETPGSLDLTVSLLPLESARIVTVGEKKKRISSEVKFIHINAENKLGLALTPSVKKIKNLVYRNKVDRKISEQKSRLAALEETMMLERERRFNRLDCMKKMQRTSSPFTSKDHAKKKFKRTEDKKGEENKKFKRAKDHSQEAKDDERKMIQAKLVKKMREDLEGQNISRIPQQNSQMNESNLLEKIQVFSQSVKESELLLDDEIQKESKVEKENIVKDVREANESNKA